MGVIQAIMSVFADDGDKLKSIHCRDGRTRITFLVRGPLYFVCVSRWGEPESVVRLPMRFIRAVSDSTRTA